MTRKTFEFEPTEDTQVQRPQFSLGGQDFDCRDGSVMSSLDALELIAGMTAGNNSARIQTVTRMFAAALPDDDNLDDEGNLGPSTLDRFREVVRTKRVPVSTLVEVASYVLDEYLRFPTRAEEPPSSNGSTPAASSNGAGSSELPAETSVTSPSSSS